MKKFFIIFFILALFVCFTLVSSASEYDFIPNYDSYIIQPYEYIYSYSSDNYNGYSCCLLNATSDNSTIWYAQPYSFILVVDTLLGTYHNATYLDFKSYCTDHCNDTGDMFLMYWSDGYCSDLNESFFNKIYYYSGAKTYDEGVTDGIKQAHDFTKDFLADNNILYEPWGSTGELGSLEGLLDDNVLPALNNYYNSGFHTGKRDGYIEGESVGYENGSAEGYAAGKSDGIIEGEKLGYSKGKVDGIAIGETTSDSLRQGIFAIISAPIELISGVLNFELFGINLFALVTGLLTLCLAIWVIKKFIKG